MLEITRSTAGVYKVHAEILIPYSVTKIFGFFAQSQNLEALTPPWLNFQIITPLPIKMCTGALIDYQLKRHGFPIKWKTEIRDWELPFRFVDTQLKGPYRLWHHEHIFREETVSDTRVRYSSVLGGALVNWLFVQKDIERIFNYRLEQLRKFKPAKLAIGS
jgi:ligand-binding SRPBCC domain-containing protein